MEDLMMYGWTIQFIISSKLPSDRPNNHSRSRELRTFLYDVADL